MRDLARIPIILKELEQLWLKDPNLRFGQLIYNINDIKNNGADIFFPEDNQWLKWIKEFNKY